MYSSEDSDDSDVDMKRVLGGIPPKLTIQSLRSSPRIKSKSMVPPSSAQKTPTFTTRREGGSSFQEMGTKSK